MSSRLDSTTSASRDFEDYIASLYRSLGYNTERRVLLGGQQIDIVAQKYIEGAGLIVLAVECKYHQAPVSNQLVQDFVSTILALRALNIVTAGAMVAQTGFTSAAKGIAYQLPFISLLEPDDLSGSALNADASLRQVVASYEGTDIFEHYIHLDATVAAWTETAILDTNDATHVPQIDSTILDWISLNHCSILLVLADFGAGKTTLLRYIQYQLSRSYLRSAEGRFPLVVSLKNYGAAHDILDLIRYSFRDEHSIDISRPAVQRYLHSGSMVLLVDGFDEMLPKSDRARRLEAFHELLPALTSPCPAILTSRPGYFVDRSEVEGYFALLRSRLSPLPSTPQQVSQAGLRRSQRFDDLKAGVLDRNRKASLALELPSHEAVVMLRLNSLTTEQVATYLSGHEAEIINASGSDSRALLNFLSRVYDLQDLSRRPFLLRLILDTVREGGLNPAQTTTPFGPSGLYELYTSLKLDFDWDKGEVRRAITREDRRTLAQAIAMAMHRTGATEVSLADVLSEVGSLRPARSESVDRTQPKTDAAPFAEEEPELSLEEIVSDLLTCSFLTITESYKVKFIHKSLYEFFVARVLRDGLSIDNPVLNEPLSQEILYFLGGFAPTDRPVLQRLWKLFERATLPSNHNMAVLRRNVLAACLHTSSGHFGRTLRNVRLFDLRYGDLSFDNTRAEDMGWERVSIQNLNLASTIWNAVTVHECKIDSLRVVGGRTTIRATDSEFPRIDIEGSSFILEAENCVIGSISGRECRFDAVVSGAEGSALYLRNSIASLATSSSTAVGVVSVADSRLWLGRYRNEKSHCRVDELTANGSIVRIEGEASVVTWHLQDAVVVGTRSTRLNTTPQSDPNSIALFCSEPLLRSPAGGWQSGVFAPGLLRIGASSVGAAALGAEGWRYYGIASASGDSVTFEPGPYSGVGMCEWPSPLSIVGAFRVRFESTVLNDRGGCGFAACLSSPPGKSSPSRLGAFGVDASYLGTAGVAVLVRTGLSDKGEDLWIVSLVRGIGGDAMESSELDVLASAEVLRSNQRVDVELTVGGPKVSVSLDGVRVLSANVRAADELLLSFGAHCDDGSSVTLQGLDLVATPEEIPWGVLYLNEEDADRVLDPKREWTPLGPWALVARNRWFTRAITDSGVLRSVGALVEMARGSSDVSVGRIRALMAQARAEVRSVLDSRQGR